VEPLPRLTIQDEPFVWDPEQQLAFETMITAFTTALAFHHFDHESDVIIETYTSDYVSTGDFSQCVIKDVLHPIAYFTKKHTPAKCNYNEHDKEVIVINKAPQEWRPECEGAAYS
jgi:hypothetical protein